MSNVTSDLVLLDLDLLVECIFLVSVAVHLLVETINRLQAAGNMGKANDLVASVL